jgi:hypothetical protein
MRSDPRSRTIAQRLRIPIFVTAVPFAMMAAIQGHLIHRASYHQAEELMQRLSNLVAAGAS